MSNTTNTVLRKTEYQSHACLEYHYTYSRRFFTFLPPANQKRVLSATLAEIRDDGMNFFDAKYSAVPFTYTVVMVTPTHVYSAKTNQGKNYFVRVKNGVVTCQALEALPGEEIAEMKIPPLEAGEQAFVVTVGSDVPEKDLHEAINSGDREKIKQLSIITSVEPASGVTRYATIFKDYSYQRRDCRSISQSCSEDFGRMLNDTARSEHFHWLNEMRILIEACCFYERDLLAELLEKSPMPVVNSLLKTKQEERDASWKMVAPIGGKSYSSVALSNFFHDTSEKVYKLHDERQWTEAEKASLRDAAKKYEAQHGDDSFAKATEAYLVVNEFRNQLMKPTLFRETQQRYAAYRSNRVDDYNAIPEEAKPYFKQTEEPLVFPTKVVQDFLYDKSKRGTILAHQDGRSLGQKFLDAICRGLARLFRFTELENVYFEDDLLPPTGASFLGKKRLLDTIGGRGEPVIHDVARRLLNMKTPAGYLKDYLPAEAQNFLLKEGSDFVETLQAILSQLGYTSDDDLRRLKRDYCAKLVEAIINTTAARRGFSFFKSIELSALSSNTGNIVTIMKACFPEPSAPPLPADEGTVVEHPAVDSTSPHSPVDDAPPAYDTVVPSPS